MGDDSFAGSVFKLKICSMGSLNDFSFSSTRKGLLFVREYRNGVVVVAGDLDT